MTYEFHTSAHSSGCNGNYYTVLLQCIFLNKMRMAYLNQIVYESDMLLLCSIHVTYDETAILWIVLIIWTWKLCNSNWSTTKRIDVIRNGIKF